MMILRKVSALVFFIVLVLQLTSHAQTPGENVVRDDVPASTKQAAAAKLTDLAREASQLALPENRLSAEIQIGGLIWKHNESEARQILDRATAELANMMAVNNVPTGLEMRSSDRARLFGYRQVLADLRIELILTLAAVDSKAALDALARLKMTIIEEYDPMRTDELELKITEAIARNNPDESYAVAKKQLEANGINYQFVEALKNLHKKDPKLSAALARDILDKVRAAKIRVPPSSGTVQGKKEKGEIDFWELSSFIMAATQMNRTSAVDKSKKTPPIIADTEMRELVGLLATAFINEPDPSVYSISQALPEIVRHTPLLAQRIRKKIGPALSAQLDKTAESNLYYQSDDKSPDELARMAAVSAADVRDSRFAFAVSKALERNDPEKAQVIASRIGDRKPYGYLFEQIDAALPLAKARRGDLDAVRGILATLRSDQERIATLTELAATLAGKGDRDAAKMLLDESRQMINTYLKRVSDLESTVKVAAVYAVASPDDAFSMLESGIGQMNDYIGAGVKLGEFYDSNSNEIDELSFPTISRQMLIHVPNSSTLMRNLAVADFERAMTLAEGFQRPEIRIFVRLRIVESVLDKNASEKERSRLEQVSGDDETE